MSNATFAQQGNDPFIDFAQDFERLRNPSKGDLEPVSGAIRQGIAENFANESSGGGQKWKALGPATAKDRQRQGYGSAGPILRRTDSLLDSLINENNADHVIAMATSGDGWTYQEGSNDERTAWLGEGTSTIPARPMMYLSESAAGQVADEVERMMDRLLGL